MRIELLKRFIVIAEELNLTVAAEKLFVAQPLLSKQLKQLEEEYGCKLLNRTTTNMTLTPEGEILYERAKTICDIDLNMRKEIAANKRRGKRILKLAIPPFIASYYFSERIGEFIAKYPFVRLNVIEGGSFSTLQYLKSGAADIAVAHSTAGALSEKNLFYRREAKFILAYSKKDFPSFVGRDVVSARDLEDVPLYICDRYLSLFHASEDTSNLRFNIFCTSDVLSTGINMVENGYAVGLFPIYTRRTIMNNGELGVCLVDDEYLRLDLNVLMAAGKKPDPMMRDLIENISESLDKMFEKDQE